MELELVRQDPLFIKPNLSHFRLNHNTVLHISKNKFVRQPLLPGERCGGGSGRGKRDLKKLKVLCKKAAPNLHVGVAIMLEAKT